MTRSLHARGAGFPCIHLSYVVCVWLLLVASASAQTNPCTAPPPTGTVINPNTVYLLLPDFNATIPNVTPAKAEFDELQVAYWPAGADPNATPPTLGPFAVAKAAMQPVAGAANCYSLVWPTQIPVGGVVQVNAFRKRRDAFGGEPVVFSPYSGAGNPFQVVSSALAAPAPPINRRQ